MRGKARYNKPPTFSEKVLARIAEEPDPFSAKVKEQIRSVLTVKGVRLGPDPELLEAELISEGRWALGQLEGIALRVVRLARSSGLQINAAGQAGDLASFSVVIRLLRLIGAQAGIRYELSTWRNIVGKIKKAPSAH